MKKAFQKLIYSIGINVSAYDVDEELRLLKVHLPSDFKKRRVIDIGCGDGKTSLRLKKILKPISFEGVDLSSSLTSTAQKRGLDVKMKDVAEEEIGGDLGILWGVIHHFKEPVKTLRKIYNNFNSLIIRAPIDEKRVCELGQKFDKREFMDILSQAGITPQDQTIVEAHKNKSLIVFVNH